MPALGADMEQGTLVEWRVQPGSVVKSGDVVAVVETQKGAIDVEIFLDGVIDDLVPLGTALPVGAVLARVASRGVGAAPPRSPEPSRPVQPMAAAPPALETPQASQPALRPRVSPAARQRGRELGIAPERLTGTGPDGSVVLRDVENAGASAALPSPAARAAFDQTQMRAAIAAAMSRSKREIPHYYLQQAMDFGPCEAWLADYNATRPPELRLLPAVLLLKAAAKALVAVPQLNGFYEGTAVRLAPEVHVGWAVSLRGGGLVAPAIHDVPGKTPPQLMLALRDLVQRARSGRLRSSELADPTVTVTSLGERGADSVLAVVVPPQLAVIGFGRICARPWVVDRQVVPRSIVQVSLAADHRASDGHLGGLLLAALDDALLRPELL